MHSNSSPDLVPKIALCVFLQELPELCDGGDDQSGEVMMLNLH